MESSTSARKITITTSEGSLGLCKDIQPLLPGIPDEISLDQICTKLPWRAFKSLSSVSSTWQKAIESGQAHNARVRAGSTETLVVHCHSPKFTTALYSRTDQCCYELPPIPHLGDRFSLSCECIGLDGKIYVLGGLKPGTTAASADVFVLDVARGGAWKQCASMQEPKLGCGCGISGGKIYVFGGSSGTSHQKPVRGSEVYDPEMDAWSPIAPMPSLRWDHRVAAVGEEFFIYGGLLFNPDVFEFDTNARVDGDPDSIDSDAVDDTEFFINVSDMEVYHPEKNEWREVCAKTCPYDTVFMRRGEMHSMSDDGISVCDLDNDSWVERHTNSFPQFGDGHPVFLFTALAVDDDVFVTSLRINQNRFEMAFRNMSLLRTQAFDRSTKEIVWQETGCRHGSDRNIGLSPLKL